MSQFKCQHHARIPASRHGSNPQSNTCVICNKLLSWLMFVVTNTCPCRLLHILHGRLTMKIPQVVASALEFPVTGFSRRHWCHGLPSKACWLRSEAELRAAQTHGSAVPALPHHTLRPWGLTLVQVQSRPKHHLLSASKSGNFSADCSVCTCSSRSRRIQRGPRTPNPTKALPALPRASPFCALPAVASRMKGFSGYTLLL